jgi:hypothetical protein
MTISYLRSMGYDEKYLRKHHPEAFTSEPLITGKMPRMRKKPTTVSMYEYDPDKSVYENWAREMINEENLTVNKLRKNLRDFIQEQIDDLDVF